MVRRKLFGAVAVVATITAMGLGAAGRVAAQSTAYNEVVFSPFPIAANASLAPGAAVTVCVRAEQNGVVVPDASVALSFSTADVPKGESATGESASVGTTALTSSPTPFTTPTGAGTCTTTGGTSLSDALAITYTAPTSYPSPQQAGQDVITATNPMTPTVTDSVAYNFNPLAKFVFSATPIAPTGSLAPGTHVSLTVEAETSAGAAVPDADFSLALTSTASSSGGATAIDGSGHTRTLGATPTDLGANSSGLVSITYTASLASSGTDTITANKVLSGGPVTATTTYTYAATSVPATTYTPLPPYRAVDTRSPSCMQCGTGALGPGETRTFTVGGYKPTGYTGSVVPATAAAVTLNVTAVDPTSSTYLTVFPAGSARPLASNLNPAAHSIIAALVTVKLGTGGGIAVYNPVGSINVVVDVEGYFTQSSGTTGRFHSVAPAIRVCDTRSGQGTLCNSGTSNPLGAQAARAVSIATPAGIPSGSAAAVVLNLVGIDGTAGTYLTAYPPDPTTHACGTPPTASNLNLAAHTVQANRVVVPIDPSSGDVCIYNAAGQINFLIDVNGWFGGSSDSLASSGLFFHPLAPFRICDTRAGSGLPCQGQSIGSGSILTVQAAGEGSLPSTSGFVLLGNATVLPYLSSTYVTVYSAGSSRPGTSDINPLHNKVTTNMVYVRVSSTGVAVFNASGTIDFILDVAGWFA